LARTFAQVVGSDRWFENATLSLIGEGSTDDERASLWFELARAKLLRRHSGESVDSPDSTDSGIAGAVTAIDGLTSADEGMWLGRVLGAYALGLPRASAASSADSAVMRAPHRSPERLELLASADKDSDRARALYVVASVLRVRMGDKSGAIERLRVLHEHDEKDLLVGVLLADLERGNGNSGAAAAVLSKCASIVEDGELAAALHLEAAVLMWRLGDAARAVDAIRLAREHVADSSVVPLLWASAAIGNGTLEERREVLGLSEESGADAVSVALDRFALESGAGGDAGQAQLSLDVLEREGEGDLRVAGWLGRLIHTSEYEDEGSRERALDGLDVLGVRASAVIAAERYRYAQTEGVDRGAARDLARTWAMADGGVASAIEWLAASCAAEDDASEGQARRLLARQVQGSTACALEASALLLDLVGSGVPDQSALLDRDEPPAQLMNLELAPAGCDPRRRADALLGLGDALGEGAGTDATMLAGWSLLAAGDAKTALRIFRQVCTSREDDIVAWEGVRTAASVCGDVRWNAAACEQLGALCVDDARAAEFYETAGLLWIDHGNDPEQGEKALAKGFQRDGKRPVCFDRLFRRVRAREDNDYLLALISRRLEFADDAAEIVKMFWEQARVLRQKGDFEGAMSALENVTMMEPDHVGALALSGEVYTRQGAYAEAVEAHARLAGLRAAPAQLRLVSGMTAVDLCENRLRNHKKAMEVLMVLHTTGLSNMPVRERLAKSAVKNEAWAMATDVLNVLMNERDSASGRVDAARLAMGIHRDRTREPQKAMLAVAKLLSESPADAEAINFLIDNPEVGDKREREKYLSKARKTVTTSLSSKPDADGVALLSSIAKEQGNLLLRQSCLGISVALGRGDSVVQRELEQLDKRVVVVPTVAIDDATVVAIGDPRDTGALTALFAQIGPVIAEALGPTLNGLSVTKKNRVDPRDGLPLRNEIASWAGALGLSEFDLYVGGRDSNAVVGIPGEKPVLVVGTDITAPLSPHARQAVARELFGIRRGLSVLRTRDATTVACIAIGLCNAVGVPMDAPPYAMLAETQKLMAKALPRRLKNVLPELCAAVATSRVDPIRWVASAHSSLDRMAAIAAGDISYVLADVCGVSRDRLSTVVASDQRAVQLIAFVLGDKYLELRTQLGMGVR